MVKHIAIVTWASFAVALPHVQMYTGVLHFANTGGNTFGLATISRDKIAAEGLGQLQQFNGVCDWECSCRRASFPSRRPRAVGGIFPNKGHFPHDEGGPRSRRQRKKPELLLTTIRNQGRGVRDHPEGGHTPLKSSRGTLISIELKIKPSKLPERPIGDQTIFTIIKNFSCDSYKLFWNRRF